MNHGWEVAFYGGLLCLRVEERLQVCSAFFYRGNRLLERAVVGLAEVCLGGREETLGVFVIGAEGEGLGESLFCIAIVAAIEQDLAVHGPDFIIVLCLGECFFADGAGFFVATEEHEGIHEGFAKFLAHAKATANAVQDIDGFGVLVKTHVSLGEVNAQAGARLGVVETLHHNEGLVALSQAPERIAQVDDVFRIVWGVAEGRFGAFTGVTVVEQCFVHFAENGEQLAVFTHEIHLACEIADAGAIKFLHLVHKAAVDQIERFFRVHLVCTFKVAEGHKRLVFEQAENTDLAHDGGVELVLLFAGFFVTCGLGHGTDLEAANRVLHDGCVFLLVDALCPGGNQYAASVIVEISTCIIEVIFVDDMGEGKFLGVAVTNLDALDFEARLVHGEPKTVQKNLEHVLLTDFVARDNRAVYKKRNIFFFVAEHQVWVFVLTGDTGPGVPKRIACAPGIAEICTSMLHDAFGREFRNFFFHDVFQLECRKEVFPFLLEGACGELGVRCGERERENSIPGANHETDGFVGRVVAFAGHIKECACGAKCFFRVSLGKCCLLAARFERLHFDLGTVHETERFTFGEHHFDENGSAPCLRVVKFIGGIVFAADDCPSVVRCGKCATARFYCTAGSDCGRSFFGNIVRG